MFEIYASVQADPNKVSFAQHQYFTTYREAKAFCETYASAVIAVRGETIAQWTGSCWTVA